MFPSGCHECNPEQCRYQRKRVRPYIFWRTPTCQPAGWGIGPRCVRRGGARPLSGWIRRSEEQRDAVAHTAVAEVAGPVQVHGPVIGAGFAADDDPADPGQAEGGQRPEQRFTRHIGSRPGWCAARPHASSSCHPRSRSRSTRSPAASPRRGNLNRGSCFAAPRPGGRRTAAGPPSARCRETGTFQHTAQPGRALGQQLEGVLWRERHHREHPGGERGPDAGVADVGH
jgi:hypothetical protein